ncbi:MAG TPA: hypothetical protein VIF57_19960 [Polyangia bacterium]|jgi:hypothetical protein
MPMSTTVRPPTDAERAVIARRTDLRRGAAAGVWRARGGELTGLGVGFGAASVALAVAIVKWPSVPLAFGLAMCVMFAAFTLAGRRKDRERLATEAIETAGAQAERERAVTEYRLAADRIVVASGAGGTGDTWWFFGADDGRWLVLERGQWEDLDPDGQSWSRDVTLAVDGHHTVVSVASAGAPVSVERRDLRPPDFAPGPDARFWTPPDDLGPLPAVLTAEPALRRLEET